MEHGYVTPGVPRRRIGVVSTRPRIEKFGLRERLDGRGIRRTWPIILELFPASY